MLDSLTPETSSLDFKEQNLNSLLYLPSPMVSEPCWGLFVPPPHHTDLCSEACPTIPIEDHQCVWVLLGKAVTSSSTLTLGLTPNSRQLLHIFGLYQNRFFSMEISLRLQTLQVGPIKQWPIGRSFSNGMNQTLADFNRIQFTFNLLNLRLRNY